MRALTGLSILILVAILANMNAFSQIRRLPAKRPASKPAKKTPFKPTTTKVKLAGMDMVKYETEHMCYVCPRNWNSSLHRAALPVWKELQKCAPDYPEILAKHSDDYGGQKPLIIVVEDEKDYLKIRDWYIAILKKEEREKEAASATQLWEHSGAYPLWFKNGIDDLAMKTRMATCCRLKDKATKSKPVFTHFVASYLLKHYNVLKHRFMTPFWLSAGYGYQTEILLCKQSATQYLDFRAYSDSLSPDAKKGGKISNSKVFEDGKGWARNVKKLLRDKKYVAPTIPQLFIAAPRSCTPEFSGFIFAFGRFLTHNEDHQKKFQEMLTLFAEKDGVTTVNLAKAYGYETIDDMQDAWYAYLKSTKFR